MIRRGRSACAFAQRARRELLEDTPGALWSHGSIEASRLRSAADELLCPTAGAPRMLGTQGGLGEGRIASPAPPDDILLTYAVYKIEPGWACRAKPQRGAASDIPQTRATSLGFATAMRNPGVAAAVADRVAERSPKTLAKSGLWRCCGSNGGRGRWLLCAHADASPKRRLTRFAAAPSDLRRRSRALWFRSRALWFPGFSPSFSKAAGVKSAT